MGGAGGAGVLSGQQPKWPGAASTAPAVPNTYRGGVEMADVTAVPVVPEDKPGPTVDEVVALIARIDQMHERVTRDLAAWDAEAALREALR